MNSNIERLERMIMAEPGVYDPPNVHHEFAGGGHGRKLSLIEIDQNSPTYILMIETEAETIKNLYYPLPDVLVGMANSANRIASDTSKYLGITALETEKNELGNIVPTFLARLALKKIEPEFMLVIEDVGTTGSSVAKFINNLQSKYDVPSIEVLFTWLRQPELPILKRKNIPYSTVINHPLKTYSSAKECYEDPLGYCANGIQLISRP